MNIRLLLVLTLAVLVIAAEAKRRRGKKGKPKWKRNRNKNKNKNREDTIVGGGSFSCSTAVHYKATCWIEDLSGGTPGPLRCGCTWLGSSNTRSYVATVSSDCTAPSNSDLRVHLRDCCRNMTDTCEDSFIVNKRWTDPTCGLVVFRLDGALPSSCRGPNPMDCQQEAWDGANKINAVQLGWGSTSAGGSTETCLRYVDLDAYSGVPGACSNQYGAAVDPACHICAKRGNSYKGSCYGDGGTPLYAQQSLNVIGIAQYVGCDNAGLWSVFISTEKVCSFIFDKVGCSLKDMYKWSSWNSEDTPNSGGSDDETITCAKQPCDNGDAICRPARRLISPKSAGGSYCTAGSNGGSRAGCYLTSSGDLGPRNRVTGFTCTNNPNAAQVPCNRCCDWEARYKCYKNGFSTNVLGC